MDRKMIKDLMQPMPLTKNINQKEMYRKMTKDLMLPMPLIKNINQKKWTEK